MTTTRKRTAIKVHVYEETHARLLAAKEETGVPLSELIKDAIEFYLDSHQVGINTIGVPPIEATEEGTIYTMDVSDIPDCVPQDVNLQRLLK